MAEWLKESSWAGSRPAAWYRYEIDEPPEKPMSGTGEALFLLNGKHLYQHEIENVLKFLAMHNVEPSKIKPSLRWRYQHLYNANQREAS